MENLAWGLEITVIGMGLVLGLLALLWGLLVLVMRLDNPAPTPIGDQGRDDASTGAADRQVPADAIADDATRLVRADATADEMTRRMDPDLVAAILVATLAHKAWRRQEAAPLMRSYWPGSLLYASRWVASGRMRQNSYWQGRR